jgi:hypothetical protein
MATWPGTLPQLPMHQGFSQRKQSNVIRSPMGYGPAKSRRRTTAAIQVFTASMILTEAQKDTLVSFYDSDAGEGSISFSWVDPLMGTNESLRFTAPIQWSSKGPEVWLAVMNLEILP